MSPSPRKHVLLLSPSALTFQGMAKHGGIQHYLRANRVRWDVRIGGDHYGHAHSRDSFMREFDYGVDGILLDDVADPQTLHRIIESRVPVVSMDWCAQLRQDGVRFANVSLDESVVGKRAAAYLTEDSAYESYAYADFQPLVNWSKNRLSAFQTALSERGYACTALLSFEGLERLRQLPKPLAILAANDWIANTVTQRCELMGLRVPEEVAVLGVDDEIAICDHANPPISSIQPDFHACGYKAAALMTELLAGKRVAPLSTYGIREIRERQSTGFPSSAGRLIRLADEIIRRNVRKPLGSDELANRLHVSRRLLDLRYRQIRHMSVLQAVHAARLREVRDLLEGSSCSIGEIAATCGFSSQVSLANLFKAKFGMTMKEYRRRPSASRH